MLIKLRLCLQLPSLPYRVNVCLMENTEITLFCIVFACNQGWIGEVRDGSYFVQCDLSVFIHRLQQPLEWKRNV